MSEAVRVYIERVKAALAVTTDEELASKIGYSKQSITNWRRRNGVPHKAELRIVSILGDDFVIREPSSVTGRVKWDDVVHGLAIFAVDRYTAHWHRPLRPLQVRAIGRRFEELEAQIRKLTEAYVTSYPQAEIFEIVMRLIEKSADQQIDDLLSVFFDDDFLENEA